MNAIEQNLERSFKLLIDRADPLEFLKGLAEYLDYVFNTPVLKQVFDEQIKEKEYMYERVEKTEEKSVSEMNKAKLKLLKILKEKNIDVSNFVCIATHLRNQRASDGSIVGRNILEDLRDYESEIIYKGGYRSVNIENYLYDICFNLTKLGYADEIKEYTLSNEEYSKYWSEITGPSQYVFQYNENGNFIFSKTLPARHKALATLNTERDIKPWGYFDRLLNFKTAYDLMSVNEDHWQSLEKSNSNNLLRNSDFVDVGNMSRDLKRILSSNRLLLERPTLSPYDLMHLPVDTFKSDVKSVHNRLMQRLSVEATTGSITTHNELSKINTITFIERPPKDKPMYGFYVNGNINNILNLRKDSGRIKKFIAVQKGTKIQFDKEVMDYVNSNPKCTLYCNGMYQTTRILERQGDFLSITDEIKVRIINTVQHKKEINKLKKA